MYLCVAWCGGNECMSRSAGTQRTNECSDCKNCDRYEYVPTKSIVQNLLSNYLNFFVSIFCPFRTHAGRFGNTMLIVPVMEFGRATSHDTTVRPNTKCTKWRHTHRQYIKGISHKPCIRKRYRSRLLICTIAPHELTTHQLPLDSLSCLLLQRRICLKK